jgi:hypothetical protein
VAGALVLLGWGFLYCGLRHSANFFWANQPVPDEPFRIGLSILRLGP